LRWWGERDRATFDKVLALVEDVLDGDPFTGKGKPEPLKFLGAGIWSRRISLEHRLVYRVEGNTVYFLQARYHYA